MLEPLSKQSAAKARALVKNSPALFSVVAFLRRHYLFALTVVLPTFLSIIYFGLIASDIYTSQSSFVVRSPQQQAAPTGISSILQRAGGMSSSGQDDISTVKSYILSRDALRDLNDQLDLTKTWSSGKIDFLHRFGFFGFRRNFEYLYEYYQGRVTMDADSHSSVSTLTVKVFSPEQALKINQLLLDAAEQLVNKLNQRAQTDLVGFAEREVKANQAEVEAAALALSTYRDKESVVDPEKQSSFHFESIRSMQDNLIATKTELAKLRAFTPNNPNQATLELRIKTIQQSMDEELAKVAGGANSLSSKDAAFQQLDLKREFTRQQLASALASLEVARSEARRQQLYLEIVSKPMRPDVAVEPHRIQSVFVTIVIGFVAWGVASMLLAGIREHQM